MYYFILSILLLKYVQDVLLFEVSAVSYSRPMVLLVSNCGGGGRFDADVNACGRRRCTYHGRCVNERCPTAVNELLSWMWIWKSVDAKDDGAWRKRESRGSSRR